MPANKRATEETSKPATKTTSKGAVTPASKAAAKSANKPATKTATKPASKAADKPAAKVDSKPAAEPVAVAASSESKVARPVASTRKPSKTALSPSEVTPLALLTPSKPARRRRSGAAKPRKLKGATTTWPFPTGSRP